jgi:hypothetical protein
LVPPLLGPTEESKRRFGLQIEESIRKVAEAIRDFCSGADEDDYCLRNARRLNMERNFLIDAQALTLSGKDKETLIAINNDIVKFNREVADHNRLCPRMRVLPLPTLGQRGIL